MDLVTYALSKKYTDDKIVELSGGIIPQIGDNGNWWINGIDTGVSATPDDNVEVDGVLKIDSNKRTISVDKDGEETIIAEYSETIAPSQIEALFAE